MLLSLNTTIVCLCSFSVQGPETDLFVVEINTLLVSPFEST